jgi:hypothetical protein
MHHILLKLFLLASKAVIELELSTTIAKLGLMISKVFLVIMGLINNRMIPNNDRKRNKAKTNSALICFWLYKILIIG